MTANAWFERLQRFPLHQIATPTPTPTPTGRVAWRQAGGGPAVTHVLLHGIGSSSANWLAQLEAASDSPAVRVLAWDAPGYGGSDALTEHSPAAADYAQRLWDWLDELAAHAEPPGSASGAARPSKQVPITLVGHSLGCLMAASAAQQAPGRIRQLILLSPAQGYAQAPAAEREKKLQDRLDLLARAGPAGMAQLRGAAMLGPHGDADQVAQVQHIMAQIDPHGYTQAARMLAGGDLLADLSRFAALAQQAPQAHKQHKQHKPDWLCQRRSASSLPVAVPTPSRRLRVASRLPRTSAHRTFHSVRWGMPARSRPLTKSPA